jgi:1-acyl-sn-glycerol-3-phosphate acyltransferase
MNPSDANQPMRLLGEAVIGSFMGAVWGVKATGLDRVPRTGALIVACNHVSLFDPLLLYAAIAPARRPYSLAKKELFQNPVSNWFFRSAGTIPLDRGGDATGAMRAALDVLEKGGCLAIYPEGTRGASGRNRSPKAGVSFLAARSRAPVVPVRLIGTDKFPQAFPLEARFGEPMPPLESAGREAELAYARTVMDAVYSL